MAIVIPAGFALAAYRFTLAGDAEEMLFTIGVAVPDALSSQQKVNTLFDQWVAAVPAANMLTGYSFLGVRLRVGTGNSPATVWESTQAVVVGSNAGPALPPNCAFLVRKRTQLGGRAHRGRAYLPAGLGVGEDSVPSTGVMLEAQRSVLQTRVDAALPVADKVILHDSLTPGALSPTPITSYRVEARLATQRRRLRP